MPIPLERSNSLRASYYFYGSLLGRYGQSGSLGFLVGVTLAPSVDLHFEGL